MATHWIWQQPDWPDFNWQAERLTPLLRECVQAQGQLMGMAGSVGDSLGAQTELDALLQNIVTSSAIEGEQLNVGSVRSSLARRLGLELIDGDNVSQRSEGLAQLMLDATRRLADPLTLERLLEWHQWLFPDQEADLTARRMHVGALRGDEPMQVVSGRIDRPTVHFEAPPRQGLEQQLNQFLQWFEACRYQTALDPMLRAGIAHFWFVTLHPFDDGNGRLTRTITDLALAQGEAQAIRFYAMSASILDDRSGYYRILESSQKATLDITEWLTWFLQTLLSSLQQAITRIESVLGNTRFWQAHRESELSAEQVKVLNRLLDGGERGFEHGISAGQYQAVAKVSKATATRHLVELLEKGCLQRLPGGGRSTRYQINYPDRAKH
ncbi:cell filamentation protein Fic [Pseudomonas sp. MYb2]|uniref:Fic family protein n=1 Tax=unclassified Pseudomonas TaxID=196821 RepID=UPI000CFED7ED|nr:MULTISPECIES: Fic family protein [unclassified Pseudomonas]PRB43234.1 cell filamentation protein Fic [Pseudomonas sp. MYb3]PRC29113.1 cell filamentation protein Fic [Pseudomonas sp. MYb2]